MRFELYQRRTLRGLRWFWRLRGDNRRIVAIGGDGYFNKADAEKGIALVRSTGPETELRELIGPASRGKRS